MTPNFAFLRLIVLCLLLAVLGNTSALQAQNGNCDTTFFKVISEPGTKLAGHTLAIDPAGNIFIGGTRDNEGLLVKCNPAGDVLWSKSLNFSQSQEFISQILLDSDGMITGCGYLGSGTFAGDAFAFRMNPQTQQLLWVQLFPNVSTYARCLLELGAGGNFILSSDTQFPNDCELIELDRMTGNPVNPFRKVYALGTGEAYNELIVSGDFIFGAGRFTDGNSFSQMRGTVSKLNRSDLSEVWTILTHLPTSSPARLYTQDMVIENNEIITVTSGDDNGSSISQTEFFLQKTDFNGNVILLKKYDVQGVANEFMQELVVVPDGYVAYGRTSIQSPSDLLVVKVDKDLNFLWARRIDYTDNDNLTEIASIQSSAVSLGDDIVFTGIASSFFLSEILLFKMNAAGEINDNCLDIVTDLPVAVTTIFSPFVKNVNLQEFNQPLATMDASPPFPDAALVASTTPCPCPVCVTPPASIAVSVCFGASYTFGNQELNQPGVYTDTLTSWQGCDSVVVLTLDFTDALFTNVNASVCEGESYVFGGNSLTFPGVYIDTLTAVAGCDSIVSLNLAVWPPVQTAVSETICSTDSFFFNGVYLTQSGMYEAVFQTIHGCDSTVTLTLDFFPYYTSQVAVTTCDGMPFVFNGQVFTQTGIYNLPYPDQNGCDSLVVLNLVVTPIVPPTQLSESLCEGETYTFYGQNLNQSGTYTQTFTTLNGCDSTIVLQLTVYEHRDTSLSLTLCEGASYDGYTQPGLYVDTLSTFAGCDSIRTLLLSFDLLADTVAVELCDGENFLDYSETGVYTDTLYGADGCDTLRTWLVTANHVYIPNVFSPDDNGVNDVFEVYLSSPTSIEITWFAVFDRWGNQVYELKNSNDVRWDGDFRGKPMNPGVLTYVMLYRCGGEEKQKSGSVTIVR